MNFHSSEETRSWYIHWPFCPYKCHFCPFVAIASHDQFMERYHQALLREIDEFLVSTDTKPIIDTLFIGGGTPSTYPPHLLLDMFDTLKTKIDFSPTAEITIEVNPGTVSVEKLNTWKACGINRMSVGVQSIKDNVLDNLNRKQSFKDVQWLLENGPQYIENISVDLILGLPDVSEEEWKQLLTQVVTWPISHVSIYFLTVHEDTQLYFKVKKSELILPPDDSIVDLYLYSINFFAQHGFIQYEVSNFAKMDKQSRHNSIYWERKPYKAFGLGACSFDGKRRFQNQKNLMKYIADIEQNKSVTIFCEELDTEQIRLERIMLGLRKSKGIDYNDLLSNIAPEKKEKTDLTLQQLIENKFMYISDSKIVLTPRGLAVQNQIISQLMS
ncbi:coproporphyrinogen III oxidase [Candidatus Dependentiae bacterium Noda2021]|nr:coproporphyrinogen III oxidase [Candidatus Dependentiae bacterium Noda2021]